ncbi:MAG: hypothetical protein F6J97_18915 [Leptolyngbya sp. SIO4C1]|nr:hypothetical protein [Leptolyngbya sp. SIO4C1]
MKGDFTRSTFQPEKHYSSVRMQQGRLQLDADWNEQVDIQNYLRQAQTQDIIGLSGVPKLDQDYAEKNFKITPLEESELDFTIAAGHIYVGGVLCELEQDITYQTQPDHPQAFADDLGNPQDAAEAAKNLLVDGECYLAYLDVWQRHLTAIDDLDIREVALTGIPDTATRTKTVWQVKLLRIEDSQQTDETQCRELAETQWQAFIAAQAKRGALKVRRVSDSSNGEAGSNGVSKPLENRLYRVEIHTSGKLGEAQFKWSQDNGTVVSEVREIKGNTISIKNAAQDERYAFESGHWVEVLSAENEKNQKPGKFVQLNAQTAGNKLVFNGAIDIPANQTVIKVRRWDQAAKEAVLTVEEGWQQLGQSGIEVKFEAESEAVFNSGDYWLIPTRSTGQIDWPHDDSNNQPSSQPPDGIQHRYCRLALLQYSASQLPSFSHIDEFNGYRQFFPPLVNCLDSTNTEEFSVQRLKVLDSTDRAPYGSLQIEGPESHKQFVFRAESGASFAFLEGDVTLMKSANSAAANLTVEGTTQAAAFIGDGSQLLGVVKTLGDAAITGSLTVSETVSANAFSGDGSNLSGVVKTNGDSNISGNLRVTGQVNAATFQGDGTGLSGLVKTAGDATITGNLTVTETVHAKAFTADSLTAAETVQAQTFFGSGAELTGIVKAQGSSSIKGSLTVDGRIAANDFQGSGALLSDIVKTQGDATITGDLTVTGAVMASTVNVGNMLQTPYVEADRIRVENLENDSSAALKHNITDFTSQEAFELLKAMSPVKYSFSSDESQKPHIGFISENMPDLVTSVDKRAIHSLEVIAILTQIVKEYRTSIVKLNRVVTAQHQKLSLLEEKVKLLEDKDQQS